MSNTDTLAELRRIQYENDGLLTAADVVKEAAPMGSPLHHYFNWDDGEAAHQYRLVQARSLIRVSVEMLPYDEPKYSVRAFVSLPSDRLQEGGGYKALVTVLEAPDLRAEMLAAALADFQRLRLKYAQLQELSSLFAEIDKRTPKKKKRPAADDSMRPSA